MSRAARQLGADQRAAADPLVSAWVSASAGSGKTTVLTARVINLLLRGTPPSRILCLTFTKAAAAEMATRVASQLARWATLPDAALRDEIVGHGGDAGEATLAAARRLFAAVLDAEGGLRIETIHAFCQSVLGRFPLEAGIAPNFEVLDERSSAELLASAEHELLQAARLGTDPVVAAALEGLAAEVGEHAVRDALRSLVGERGRLTAALGRFGGTLGVADRIAEALGLPRDPTEAALLAAAVATDACDAAGLEAAAAALAYGSAADKGRGAAIAAWLAGDGAARLDGFEAYAAQFLTKEGKPVAKVATKPVLQAAPAIEQVLRREQERLAALAERRCAIRVWTATRALLVLGSGLIERYERLKALRGRLDYDDLVLLTRRLLADIGPGWVHYKLDGGIDHILIDEAQDTNPDQWEVVDALAAEFFAGEGARGDDPERRRTLFAVGDSKQSIFRFQGAEPARFETMRAAFRARAAAAGSPWRDIAIAVSFRSAPAILRAVDQVFAGPARAGVIAEGEALTHSPHRTGAGGRIEVHPVVAADAVEPSDPWAAPTAYIPAATPAAVLAARIARMIRGWIEAGEPLPALGRPVRPGDVMILLRSREPLMGPLVRALKGADVPVAGVDRMRVQDQLAVQDLIALGEVLLLPEDDLRLATVLKSPLGGLSEDELFRLAQGRGPGERLWDRLAAAAAAEPDGRIAAVHGELAGLRARADLVPPYELYADLLGRARGRERLVARLGHEANEPLDEFLALALAHERAAPPSLQGFLHWLGAGGGEVKRDLEARADEVRIMTVHGAKGLEAPVVVLPDTVGLPPGPRSSVFWHALDDTDVPLWPPRAADREEITTALAATESASDGDEYRRLLYVALTRARDRLCIMGWRSRQDPKPDCWHRLVSEALAGEGAGDGEGPVVLEEPVEIAVEPAPLPAPRADAPLPAWALAPAPAEAGAVRMAPSAAGAEEPPVVSPAGDDGRRFRRGIMVHALLQHLPELPPDRRPAAARAWLAHAGLDPAAAAALAAECLAVLAEPAFAPLFAPGSQAEVPLAGRVAGRTVTGRVDRLAVTAEAVLIVDYKSLRPPPRRAEDVPVAYLRQMAAYRALAREIWPGREVRAALLWTETPRLMALPEALLAAHALA